MASDYRVQMRFGLPKIEPPKPGDLQRMQAKQAIYEYGLKISDPAYIAKEKEDLDNLAALIELSRVTPRYLQSLIRVPTKPGHPPIWECSLTPDDGRLDMGWNVARGDEIFARGSTPEKAIRAALAQVPEDDAHAPPDTPPTPDLEPTDEDRARDLLADYSVWLLGDIYDGYRAVVYGSWPAAIRRALYAETALKTLPRLRCPRCSRHFDNPAPGSPALDFEVERERILRLPVRTADEERFQYVAGEAVESALRSRELMRTALEQQRLCEGEVDRLRERIREMEEADQNRAIERDLADYD